MLSLRGSLPSTSGRTGQGVSTCIEQGKCGTLHARALGSKPLWLDKSQLPHVGLGVRSCSLLAMAQGALGVRGVMQRGMT